MGSLRTICLLSLSACTPLDERVEIYDVEWCADPRIESASCVVDGDTFDLAACGETVEGEGGRLMQADRYGLGDDFISAYPKRLEAVRLAQVNELAKKLLHQDKLVIVLVGPKDKLLESVKDLGTVRATWWEDDKVLQLAP